MMTDTHYYPPTQLSIVSRLSDGKLGPCTKTSAVVVEHNHPNHPSYRETSKDRDAPPDPKIDEQWTCKDDGTSRQGGAPCIIGGE